MKKFPTQGYTAEFKERPIKHARTVAVEVAARQADLVDQTLRSWMKASSVDKPTPRASKPVKPMVRPTPPGGPIRRRCSR